MEEVALVVVFKFQGQGDQERLFSDGGEAQARRRDWKVQCVFRK